MKRTTLSLCAALFALPLVLFADTVTLPAVTSLPVGSAASPFFSDVRVFNTSYTGSVSVTAVYRCFLGACPGVGPQATFVLGPRESRAFDDMILATFNSPATAGAVEFTSAGDSVRVTSRLYSPAAGGGTNGMFIPGMKVSQAYAVSVLTGLANGLFRTNIGVYNLNDVGVTATVRLFNGAAQLGSQTVNLGPRSGTQINRIFDAVGQAGLVTTNAHAVVESSSASTPLFTYGAVIDNATSDSSFVAGDEDVPPPAATTVVNLVATQFEWSFNGGGSSFTMRVGQTYELRISSGDVTHGFGGISALGLQGATLSPGSASVIRTVSPTSSQVGSRGFTCSIFCGSGHPFDGTIQVVP